MIFKYTGSVFIYQESSRLGFVSLSNGVDVPFYSTSFYAKVSRAPRIGEKVEVALNQEISSDIVIVPLDQVLGVWEIDV